MNKKLSIPDGSNLFEADNSQHYNAPEEPRGPERPFSKKGSGKADRQSKKE